MNTCQSIADGLASGWSRCERSTYQEAFDLFNQNLQCSSVQIADDPTVCLQDLQAQPCEDVDQALVPSSCLSLLDTGQ